MREEVDQLLDELESKIERVRALYDQYFLGIERAEPVIARKDVERRFATLQPMTLRNTALRFRYQTLMQRWIFLQTHWTKVLREIEAGTYAPHVARAQRRRGITLPPTLDEPAPAPPGDDEAPAFRGPRDTRRDPNFYTGEPPAGTSEPYEPFSDLVRSLREETENAPPAPAAAAPRTSVLPSSKPPGPPPVPRPAAQPSKPGQACIPGMSEGELRELHRSYQTARGQPIQYEALVTNLERQVPGLLERLQCDKVRFEVVNRDGRIILRALPRR